MIQRREANRVRYQQMNGAIQSAKHAKISRQRRNVRFWRIAHPNSDNILTVGVQRLGNFVTKRPEAAAMLSEFLPVEIHVGDRGRRLESQEIAFACFRLHV